jgi:hypothetical protein
MNPNIIIAGLAVTVVSLFVIGTVKYIRELNKIMKDEPFN